MPPILLGPRANARSSISHCFCSDRVWNRREIKLLGFDWRQLCGVVSLVASGPRDRGVNENCFHWFELIELANEYAFKLDRPRPGVEGALSISCGNSSHGRGVQSSNCRILTSLGQLTCSSIHHFIVLRVELRCSIHFACALSRVMPVMKSTQFLLPRHLLLKRGLLDLENIGSLRGGLDLMVAWRADYLFITIVFHGL